MLEQNISIDKLVEVLQRVKARDGIETITTFELLHILPSDEAVEQMRAADECPTCAGLGFVNDNRGRRGVDCSDCNGSGIRR